MGGDLASKKQQTSSSSVEDYRTVAGGDAIGAGGSNNSIFKIEGGTVVASEAIEANKEVTRISLGTVRDVIGRDLDNRLAEKSLDSNLLRDFMKNNTQVVDSTSEKLFQLAQTKVTDGANLNQKTTMVAIAAFGAMMIIPALFKK